MLSFTLSDFADVIKDKAGQGRKSLVMGRRVALAVFIIVSYKVSLLIKGCFIVIHCVKNFEREG